MIDPMTILKRPALLILVLAVALAAGAFLRALDDENAIPEDLVLASVQKIIEEVNVTGKVKAADSVELSFEGSGALAAISKKVGDPVSRSETIAWLDSAELLTELELRKTAVSTQKARLAKLEAPMPAEELAVQSAKIAAAGSAEAGAKSKLFDAIRNAYVSADDAIRGKIDQLFSNPASGEPKFTLTAGTVNPQVKADAELERIIIENLLAKWSVSLSLINNSSDPEAIASETENDLLRIQSFLDKIAIILNGATPGGIVTQSQIDGYRTSTSQARTGVSSVYTALVNSRDALKQTGANLTLAREEYRLSERGATEEELAIERAVLAEREAAVKSIQVKLGKFILRSPISGIVTAVESKAGEIILPSVPVITIQRNESLEIEANVPEVDIGKISLQNPVAVTFDAFPGEKFTGLVIHIDPAATIIDGVVNFKITVEFQDAAARVKSGLTANLAIQTVEKSALVLPQYAILENDLGTFVEEITGASSKKIPVKIGVRSQDGLAEILSGLREGAKVLNIGARRADQK